MTPDYYWPQNTQKRARSASIFPFANTLAVSDWRYQSVFTLSGTALVENDITFPIADTPLGFGLPFSTLDTSGGFWAAGYTSGLVHATSGLSYEFYSLPASAITVACVEASGFPYVYDTSGDFYSLSGTTLEKVTPSLGQLPLNVVSDGTNMYSIINAGSYVYSASSSGTVALSGDNFYTIPLQTGLLAGYYNVPLGETTSSYLPGLQPIFFSLATVSLSSQFDAFISTLNIPMKNPLFTAISSAGAIGIAGYYPAVIASGWNGISPDPTVPTQFVGVNSVSNSIDLVVYNGRTWVVSGTLVGSGDPSVCEWSPNGEQILVGNPTGGYIQVIDYQNGEILQSQSLAVSGVNSISISPDNAQAILSIPTSGTSVQLTDSAGTWSIGQSIPLTDSFASVFLNSTYLAAGVASGISWQTYSGSTWTEAASASLPFTPELLAYDGYGNIFAAANIGISGALAVVASGASGIIASGSWLGSADAIFIANDQVMVNDVGNQIVRGFAVFESALTQYASSAVIPNASVMVDVGTCVFLSSATSTQTAEYEFSLPFSFTECVSGAVELYASGTWYTGLTAINDTPTAIIFDEYENLIVATSKNNIYSMSVSGGISAASGITPYNGQLTGVPMGFSSLIWASGHLYGASSLAGFLAKIY